MNEKEPGELTEEQEKKRLEEEKDRKEREAWEWQNLVNFLASI